LGIMVMLQDYQIAVIQKSRGVAGVCMRKTTL